MKNILIVEDEVSLSDVLLEKLTHEGFSVKNSLNGRDGLALALKWHPDLILLDIIMPIMDGMTMLDKLRVDPWGKNVKVILLTNLSDPIKLKESDKQGVNDYLIKCDWTLDDIVKKVTERLDA